MKQWTFLLPMLALCGTLQAQTQPASNMSLAMITAASQQNTAGEIASAGTTGLAQAASREESEELPDVLPAEPLDEDQLPEDAALPPVEESLEARARALEYGIPMPWGEERFEQYRCYYLSTQGRKVLASVLQKAAPFMDYIINKTQELGVPVEMAYLPVIESSYSPFAVSRSGATGIWQFMKNSIRGYGMTIDEWVDERRDFMKSTDGALAKLLDNYRTFGDWNLALAAYNAGSGAVARALKAAGGAADYWQLVQKGLLSRQATDYVPKFLAVASILRYPGLYGFEPHIPEPMRWEVIKLDRQVDIKLLAAKAEIPLEVIKLGNAELHYTVTPPSPSHPLKIPADKLEAVKAVLSNPDAPLVRYEIHKVREGETLTAISRKYGISIAMITKANPGLNPDRIRIGQTLMIPMSLQPLHGSTAAMTQASLQSELYTVQKGDTLYGLARRYGTTPQKIAELNGISMNSTLRIGQKLKVPSAQ
ncbi:MAG: LysM peptidoglycan-binding domain-containing protein [Spirochaetales bacterium]|nr:LysM peptidoglycan-binding domain-containing protein [Spirochaetales bacterium]